MKFDYNAAWWNPDIKQFGKIGVNPTSTKQVLVAAVAGQRIAVVTLGFHADATTATTRDSVYYFFGTTATWLTAASAERLPAFGFTPVSSGGSIPNHLGGSPSMGSSRYPLGLSEVNKALNGITRGNVASAGTYYGTYYLINDATGRPV